MQCPRCGRPYYAQTAYCIQCGLNFQEAAKNQPKTYLVHNIVMFVLSVFLSSGGFALITGIVGLVLSILADNDVKNGNWTRAEQNARIARVLFYVTLALAVLTLLVVILWVVFMVILGVIGGGIAAAQPLSGSFYIS